MGRIRSAALLLVFGLLVGILHAEDGAAAPAKIPVRDFFRPALFSDPKLNATGTHLAAIGDEDDHFGLLVCRLKDMKIDMVRGSATKDLDAFHWLDEHHVLTSWSRQRLYADGIFVTDVRDVDGTYAVERHNVSSVIGVPRDAPLKPLIWIAQSVYGGDKDLGVFQIDSNTRLGEYRYAVPGTIQDRQHRDQYTRYGITAAVDRNYPIPKPGVSVGYLSDKDGHLAFAFTAEAGVVRLHRYSDEKWIPSPIDLDRTQVIDAGDRVDELIVIAPGPAGSPGRLCRADAVTGELGQELLADAQYDPVGCSLYRHPKTGTILGVRYLRDRSVTSWFDAAYGRLQGVLEARFPGRVVEILGSDHSEKRFLVRTYSDRESPDYHAFDSRTQALTLLKQSRPWIDPAKMHKTHLMHFKTRDGLMLEAFVTVPTGASPKHPVPLVVLPHGGPHARNAWGFDPEVQFLASRGYAVLQPNYRGSPGYGWKYAACDVWNFGKMHYDVTDAVLGLLTTNRIDRSRIAIMGSSFGGYLAACGAIFEPELYRCAISVSGIFDLEQVVNEAKADEHTSARYGLLHRFLGDPKEHSALFEQLSPSRHAEQIKIPIFVAHGTDDTVAHAAGSRAFVARLKKAGVPHEALLIPGEGHGMHHLKNEVELYTRIEAFLARHLGGVD